MIDLWLQCPHCGCQQRYVNYRISQKHEVDDKRRKCIRDSCGKSFLVRKGVLKVVGRRG